MASGPLITAGVAAALLVVTLGVDVAMTTTYTLDVWSGTGWREIVRDPYKIDVYRGPEQVVVSANASDDVRFRLRVENGYLWATSEDYRVLHNGEEVAYGALATEGRGSDESEFTIPASRLLGEGTRFEPKPVGGADTYVSLQVQTDGDEAFRQYQPSFTLREVSR